CRCWRAAIASGLIRSCTPRSTSPPDRSITATVPLICGGRSVITSGSTRISIRITRGAISTPITNPLVITVAANSRRATNKVLSTRHPRRLGRRGVRLALGRAARRLLGRRGPLRPVDQVDEDVLQRGAPDLDPPHRHQ